MLLLCFSALALIPPVAADTVYLTINAYDSTQGQAVTVYISFVGGGGWGNTTVTITKPPSTFSATITANATDSYGNPLRGFLVNGILYLGSTYVIPEAETNYLVTVIYSSAASNGYLLYGLNNENSGVFTGNVSVTAYYTNINPESILLNAYSNYTTATVPQYLSYDLGNDITRQYWFEPTQTTGTLYILNGTLTPYTINFMDQTGILKSNPYVTAQTYVNGSLVTVEKRKVDSANSIIMSLEAGKKYAFTFSGSGTTYTYGEVLMTATTSVQLVIRGVDFPKETLLLYQYVHAYAVRDFLNPIGAITVSYEDINSQTTSVEVNIQYTNGISVFTQTFPSNQSFSYTWTSAVNATTYDVTITITHSIYGTFYFKQHLIGEYTKPENPFNLDSLGTIPGIETAWFIPALLIIFVAACFSELTSEVACILTVVVAWLLWAIGWISLTPSIIVTALAFAIMAGVVTVRRRFF